MISFYRSLRCLRNAIHCHLIAAFIIKNILWIVMHQTLNYLQYPSYSVSISFVQIHQALMFHSALSQLHVCTLGCIQITPTHAYASFNRNWKYANQAIHSIASVLLYVNLPVMWYMYISYLVTANLIIWKASINWINVW